MNHLYRKTLLVAGAGLLAAAAACSHDMTPTGARGAVPASIRLVSASPTPGAPVASIIGLMADDGDSGHADSGEGRGEDFHNQISLSNVDSLTVDVSKVEVKAAVADSENAADSAAEKSGDDERCEEQREHDSMPADTACAHMGGDDHENDEATWVSLDVTAGGHVNLLKLPDSASAGITVASGTLAPGTYRHVRLFVTNAMIFLKTQIVTPAGDTLKAGVPIPVKIPSADSTGAAIKTDQSFTVPTGGGSVKLVFDADDTVRHIVVTGNGTVILQPVLRAREGDHDGEH